MIVCLTSSDYDVPTCLFELATNPLIAPRWLSAAITPAKVPNEKPRGRGNDEMIGAQH